MKPFFITTLLLTLSFLALLPIACHYSPAPRSSERAIMAAWYNVPDDQDFYYDDEAAREIMERGHMDFNN